MSDYLVWAAERLEYKYGWKFEDAQEYLWDCMTNDTRIPHDISLEKYIEEELHETMA